MHHFLHINSTKIFTYNISDESVHGRRCGTIPEKKIRRRNRCVSIQKFATHIQCFDIENLSNGTHVYGRQPSFYISGTGRE